MCEWFHYYLVCHIIWYIIICVLVVFVMVMFFFPLILNLYSHNLVDWLGGCYKCLLGVT